MTLSRSVRMCSEASLKLFLNSMCYSIPMETRTKEFGFQDFFIFNFEEQSYAYVHTTRGGRAQL